MQPTKKQVLNIASLIILGLCLIMWLIVPFIRATIWNYYSYWSAYSPYYTYEGPASEIFFSMFSGGTFYTLLDTTPLAFVPLFSLVAISVGLICTLCKKMIPVRIFAIIHSVLTTLFLLIQLSLNDAYVVGHVGFWGIYLGLFVLIFLSGRRYKTL